MSLLVCRWLRSEGPVCSASLVVLRQMLVREVPQVTGHQGQKEKVVTSLGYVAMTKTWEDGMAGKHSRYLIFLEGGGSGCSVGICLSLWEGCKSVHSSCCWWPRRRGAEGGISCKRECSSPTRQDVDTQFVQSAILQVL